MSSGNSYPRCAVDVSPSRQLKLFAVSLALLAAACPWLAGLPWYLAVVVSLAVIPVALPLWHWAGGPLSQLVWQAEGYWQLRERNGRAHEDVKLQPGILVTAGVIALRWRCTECGRRFRAALLHDNCDAAALRRLRVRLRLSSDTELFEDQ